jgi:hypothetical protein
LRGDVGLGLSVTVHLRRAPVGVRRQRGDTDVGFWSGTLGSGGGVGGGGIGDGLRLSLDVGLTRLSPNSVFATEFVRDFSAVCLDLLFVPHPFGSFYAPTQTVDVETDTSFTGIVNGFRSVRRVQSRAWLAL